MAAAEREQGADKQHRGVRPAVDAAATVKLCYPARSLNT